MAILPFTPVGLTEIRAPARGLWWFRRLVVLAYAVMLWATIVEASTLHAFWTRGVERTAHVNRLDSGGAGATPGWSYEIDIGGRVFVSTFASPLDVGQSYPVLEVPGQSDVIVASSKSSLFQVYAAQEGDSMLRLLAWPVVALLLLAGPAILLRRVRARRRAPF